MRFRRDGGKAAPSAPVDKWTSTESTQAICRHPAICEDARTMMPGEAVCGSTWHAVRRWRAAIVDDVTEPSTSHVSQNSPDRYGIARCNARGCAARRAGRARWSILPRRSAPHRAGCHCPLPCRENSPGSVHVQRPMRREHDGRGPLIGSQRNFHAHCCALADGAFDNQPPVEHCGPFPHAQNYGTSLTVSDISRLRDCQNSFVADVSGMDGQPWQRTTALAHPVSRRRASTA